MTAQELGEAAEGTPAAQWSRHYSGLEEEDQQCGQ